MSGRYCSHGRKICDDFELEPCRVRHTSEESEENELVPEEEVTSIPGPVSVQLLCDVSCRVCLVAAGWAPTVSLQVQDTAKSEFDRVKIGTSGEQLAFKPLGVQRGHPNRRRGRGRSLFAAFEAVRVVM